MDQFHVLIGAMMARFQNGVVRAPLNHHQQALLQFAQHQLRALVLPLPKVPFLQTIVMLIVTNNFLLAWMCALVILFALQTVLEFILNVSQIVTIQIMSHQRLQLHKNLPQQNQPQLQLKIQFLFAITIVMKITIDVLRTAEDTTKSALNYATSKTHSVLPNVTIQIMFHRQPNQQPQQQQNQLHQPLQQPSPRQQPNSMLLLVMTPAMMNISNVLQLAVTAYPIYQISIRWINAPPIVIMPISSV
jgi:hypothetical protein